MYETYNCKSVEKPLIADPDTICIYTDGSGIESRIGAAAYSPTTGATKRQNLGQELQSNVFADELTAICMAIQIIRQHRQYTKCVLFTDSQAGIKATKKPGQQSGQAMIQKILDEVEEIKQERATIDISIIWKPGHMEIEGNEKADMKAKEAAIAEEKYGTKSTKIALKSARNASIKT